MLPPEAVKELVEIALDRELAEFDMDANLYDRYELNSMGAVAMFVELQVRTGVEVPPEIAPLLQTGSDIARFVELKSTSNSA
jgi:acyl carrier protein